MGRFSSVEKMSRRLLGPPPSASKARPEVPAALDQVLARLLTRDPSQRYQTPAELAAALVPFSRAAATEPHFTRSS